LGTHLRFIDLIATSGELFLTAMNLHNCSNQRQLVSLASQPKFYFRPLHLDR
jgi:hypothetical protein